MKLVSKSLACAAGLALAPLLPLPVAACGACYGQSDSRMTESMRWGIIAMMTVTGGVFTGIGAVAYSIWKRGRQLEAATGNVDLPAGGSQPGASGMHI